MVGPIAPKVFDKENQSGSLTFGERHLICGVGIHKIIFLEEDACWVFSEKFNSERLILIQHMD